MTLSVVRNVSTDPVPVVQKESPPTQTYIVVAAPQGGSKPRVEMKKVLMAQSAAAFHIN